MNEKTSQLIDRKIEELRIIARDNDHVMLVLFRERGEERKFGHHIAAFGTGPDLRNLILRAMHHRPDLKNIFQAAINEFEFI